MRREMAAVTLDHVVVDPANEHSIIDVVQRLVPPLASASRDTLDIRTVSGGITNQLFRVKEKGGSLSVLIRIFGHKSELLIDRAKELKAFQELNSEGLSSPLYGCFDNGYVYGFFRGRALTAEDLASGEFMPLVMKQLARFHDFVPESIPRPDRCETFTYVELLHEEACSALQDHPEVEERVTNLSLSTLMRQVESAERALCEGLDVRESVVFCHNDLLPGNIIWNPEDGSIQFIDYEYCGWNLPAHDLGNHWCEFTGLEVHTSNYPGSESRRRMLREYLARRNLDSGQESVTRLEQQSLISSVVANVQWILWCILQHANSELDFDYLQYLQLRVNLHAHLLEQTADFF